MAVECTGRNVEVTPSLRELAEERAQRLERHLGGPARVRVVLSHQKHRYGAEVIATHRRRRWEATEETADARAALSAAFEKIDAQAMRDTEKRRDRFTVFASSRDICCMPASIVAIWWRGNARRMIWIKDSPDRRA